MRRAALRRSRRPKAEANPFHEIVTTGGGCLLEDDRCAGPLDAHHVIPRDVIRRHFPAGQVRGFLRGKWALTEAADATSVWWWDYQMAEGLLDEAICVPLSELLADPRNGVPLCRAHHAQLTARATGIPRDRLPSQAEIFARESGLSWRLDRDYGRAA